MHSLRATAVPFVQVRRWSFDRDDWRGVVDYSTTAGKTARLRDEDGRSRQTARAQVVERRIGFGEWIDLDVRAK